ncbi:MAG: erythromycin esterase family protein [Gemmatimonadaceae bacterium]|nr:erythromycin esterase family protein [Gemmatimonadaceae bacterium]
MDSLHTSETSFFGRALRACGALLLTLQLVACAHTPSRVVPAASMNLGFEEAQGRLPAGWNAGPLGGFHVAADSETVHTGVRSVRITSSPDGRYGSLVKRIDAGPLVGKRVRLHGWVKTQGVMGWAVVFLRVDGGESAYVMSDGPVGTSAGWSEIVADAMIAPGKELTLGIALGGDGTTWFDDLTLEVVEPKPEVPIQLGGRVVDSLGRPVAGAEVALIAASGAIAQHARASADGAFQFRATSGKWALSAHASGRGGITGTFLETRDFDTNATLSLVLSAQKGVTVQGRVVGTVPDGAYLRVAAYSNFNGDVWAVPLGTDGTFAATLPSADRYAISVLSGGSGTGDAKREGDVANAVLDVLLERPVPASVPAWISRNMIPLSTADPNVPLVFSAGLRQLVGAARVVALGEATHGTREFFQLKHRIFRTLVDQGFTVFALESGQVDTRAVNAYVVDGVGNAREALGTVSMWMWETEEFFALVEWMRMWNSDPTHRKKLQFVGFDMQNPSSGVKAVRQFLNRVAPADAAALLAPIEMLQHAAGLTGFGTLPKDKQAEVVAAVAALNARFVQSQGAWEAATSPTAFAVARQDARTVQQAVEYMAAGMMSAKSRSLRDDAMAENIMWHYRNLPPGERMVVSAHNLHIADVPARMGKPLRAALGSDWLTIGFQFGDGSFQAQRARTDGALANIEAITLAPPGDHLANAALLEGGDNVYALDLRTLPASGEVASWFRSPQFVREIGYGFQSEAGMTAPQILAERYDALLFVAHTTRARGMAVDFTRLP